MQRWEAPAGTFSPPMPRLEETGTFWEFHNNCLLCGLCGLVDHKNISSSPTILMCLFYQTSVTKAIRTFTEVVQQTWCKVKNISWKNLPSTLISIKYELKRCIQFLDILFCFRDVHLLNSCKLQLICHVTYSCIRSEIYQTKCISRKGVLVELRQFLHEYVPIL